MELCEDKSILSIVIRYRDPIELIGYLLVDPILQFYWKEHISYDAKHVYAGEERVIKDLMSTVWANESEHEMRSANSINDVLIPVILYADGVALGLNNHKSSKPVLMSIGNFSDELLRKNLPNFALDICQVSIVIRRIL